MKKKVKVNAVLTVLILALFVILIFCIKDIISSIKSSIATEVKILDSIEEYGYKLDENDSPYFEELFKELKEQLKKDSIDNEEVSKLISQLFITDFYSLKYALNKNDVGGIQFVYTEYQDSFIKKAKETIYATVENNIYGKRNQSLPVVTKVEIEDINPTKFETDEETFDTAYEIDLKISYEKDLEYPTNARLIIVEKENKLQIVEMK